MLARERRKLILPFLAPFLILHTFLFAYPAIQALPLSLMDFSGIGENMRFIGLANFEELLTDNDFHEVLGVTFRFAIFGGLLTLPAGPLLRGHPQPRRIAVQRAAKAHRLCACPFLGYRHVSTLDADL